MLLYTQASEEEYWIGFLKIYLNHDLVNCLIGVRFGYFLMFGNRVDTVSVKRVSLPSRESLSSAIEPEVANLTGDEKRASAVVAKFTGLEIELVHKSQGCIKSSPGLKLLNFLENVGRYFFDSMSFFSMLGDLATELAIAYDYYGTGYETWAYMVLSFYFGSCLTLGCIAFVVSPWEEKCLAFSMWSIFFPFRVLFAALIALQKCISGADYHEIFTRMQICLTFVRAITNGIPQFAFLLYVYGETQSPAFVLFAIKVILGLIGIAYTIYTFLSHSSTNKLSFFEMFTGDAEQETLVEEIQNEKIVS